MRRDVQDRLLEELEAVVVERVADPVRPADAGAQAVSHRAAVTRHREAVAPALLGVIERDVGIREDLLGGLLVSCSISRTPIDAVA